MKIGEHFDAGPERVKQNFLEFHGEIMISYGWYLQCWNVYKFQNLCPLIFVSTGTQQDKFQYP